MRIIRFDNKGWRARFDDGFDEQNVSRVADAFGFIWADAHPGATIYVGYDTRYNGRGLAAVVAGVLASYGLRVLMSDSVCPTPALGCAVAHDPQAIGGVMLTASSASCEFGGITARAEDGGPVADEFYDAATRIVSSASIDARGGFSVVDLMGPYLDDLRACVDAGAIASAAPHLVVDPLYGAGRGYLASLLRSLGCRVHEIHGEHMPDFGGLYPRPAEPWVDTCEQAVLAYGASAGLVLDGDGDRMGLVDGEGHYITSHRTTPILLEHLVRNRGEHGRVVTTFSSSTYLRRQAQRLDCSYTAVPMGFTRIYREFVEGDIIMGADEFGGVALPAHLPERDGLLCALLIVEQMAMTGVSVAERNDQIERELGKLYYVRRDIRLDAASIQAFRNILPGLYLPEVCGMEPVSVGHSDGLVLRFEDGSWVQLRPSRTEALVRSSAEAPTLAIADQLAQVACDAALKHLPGAH